MKPIYILSSLLAMFFIACSNNEYSLVNSTYEGMVVNSITTKPFPGIYVVVTNGQNTRSSVTTDMNGKFHLLIDLDGLSNDYYILIGNSNTEKKKIAITGVGKKENDLGIIEITPATKPEVKFQNIFIFNHSTLQLTGEIEYDGLSTISEAGFYYGNSEVITDKSLKIIASITDNTFSANLKEQELKSATTYYFIPYAVNSEGTGYGTARKYTSSESTPVLSWNDYIESASSITVSAMIDNNGGAPITEYGFCWDLDGNPSLDSNTKVFEANGDVTYFSYTIEDLHPNTTYYIRPFAKNGRDGLGYGNIIRLTTLNGLPCVLTGKATATNNSIIMWGNVASSGGFKINRNGICLSGSPTPSINDIVIESTPQVGEFFVSYQNAYDGARYYYRAFAENENGLVYGSIKEVITQVLATFRVVNENGAKISNSVVYLDGSKFDCNADGILNIILPPGLYRCYAKASGYDRSTPKDIAITHNNKDFTLMVQSIKE